MTSTQRTYFERMYQHSADPWDFATSPYEQRKYAVTLASLPRAHYRAVFEPGCSIGVLSELLASRCDALLSSDIVPAALARAEQRLRGETHVTVEQRAIPEAWPCDQFDLVVLSEIAYYFDPVDLAIVMERLSASLLPRGHVVGVHWRGDTDYPLTGDACHDIIGNREDLINVVHHVEAKFLLDVWEHR